MDLAEMKRKGILKPIPVDSEQIQKLMELSKRDLLSAEKRLADDFDWSFNISYNAMLQAARALMFSYGCRTDDESRHRIAVEFADAILGAKYSAIVDDFDRMRKKRHIATYDEAGSISAYEARYAFTKAQEFVKLIESKINERIG